MHRQTREEKNRATSAGPLERAVRRVEKGRTAQAVRWLTDNALGEIVGTLAVLVTFWAAKRVADWQLFGLPLGLVLTAALTGAVVLAVILYRRRSGRLVLTAEALLALDGTLLRLLAELQRQDDRGKGMMLMLEGLLSDMTATLGEEAAARSMVLRPIDGQLRPVASHEMPQRTLERRVFPITPPHGKPRGVALAAFLDRQEQLVTFSKVDGTWQTDHPDFNWDESSTGERYRSFAVFPLIPTTGSEGATPLGVLCVDSRRDGDFQSPEEVKALGVIASRFVAAIQLAEGMPPPKPKRQRQRRTVSPRTAPVPSQVAQTDSTSDADSIRQTVTE